jgi:hypothetical protein
MTSLLPAGRLKASKKYSGQYVLVVSDRIVPLKENENEAWKDIRDLKEKYGEMPEVTFVPRTEISYILVARCRQPNFRSQKSVFWRGTMCPRFRAGWSSSKL